MKLPSASKLDRVFSCPSSAVLPQIEQAPTKYSEHGNDVHDFLSAGIIPENPASRAFCEALNVSELPVGKDAWAHEVAFSFDWVIGKARELGRGLNRDYSRTLENEFPGTADVVGISVDRETVIVLDYKTGHSNKGRAADSWQLRLLALAAARTYGCSQAKVALVHLKEDGSAWWDWADLDAFDLDEAAFALAKLGHKLTTGDVGQPKPGNHCRYCPAFNSCPAQVGLLRRMTTAPNLEADEIRAALTPETAALAYARIQQVREVLRRVDEALYAYTRQNPIQLPNPR